MANKGRDIAPPPPLSQRLLYTSAACAVVNKLCGEAVEADLPSVLAAAFSGAGCGAGPADMLPVPAAAHRLDVPVSGCVVFARTRGALAFLNAAFSRGTALNGGAVSGRGASPAGKDGAPDSAPVEKRYWAVTEMPARGLRLPDRGELVHWIRFDSQKNKSTAYDEPGPGRKKAVMRYRIAGRGDNYLFLDIELLTGRHHQIRAQLARLGLCVKGDLKYGARRSEKNGGIRLHARSLSFPDPAENGRRITVRARPPVADNLWAAFEEALTHGAGDAEK